MTQRFIFEFSEEDSKVFLSTLQEIQKLLASRTSETSEKKEAAELPLKREEILTEFNLKESTFFNLQRRGILTPLRMEGSRLTFYYRSEVLQALQKFNPKKYVR